MSSERSPDQPKRLRVAVVRGGLWDSTQAGPRTVKTLIELGHEPVIFGWNVNGDLPAEDAWDGVPVYRYGRRIPPASMKFFLCWPLWWLWLIRQFLKHKPDVVHAMNSDSAFPAGLLGLFTRLKVVYDLRDAWGMCVTNKPFPFPQLFKLFERVTAWLCSGLLLSQGDIGYCARYFGGFAARRKPAVQVLNVPMVDRGPEVQEASGVPMTINFSGRLSGLRGAFKLADIVDGRDDMRIDVYGKLSDDKIRERFEPMPNADFGGTVPYDESLDRMTAADVISILYDPSLEVVAISSANKMFESMMLGKPYISTAGAYPAMIALEHKLGFPVPYGDDEALRKTLIELAGDPAKRAEYGRNGRAAYERYFSWDRQRENMVLLYRHLLGEAPEEPPRVCAGWSRFLGSAAAVDTMA